MPELIFCSGLDANGEYEFFSEIDPQDPGVVSEASAHSVSRRCPGSDQQD
jgi:hypothetical protein